MHTTNEFLRFRLLALILFALWLGLLASTPNAFAKPTTQAIIEYGKACKKAGRKADFIKKFGTDFSGMNLQGVDFRGPHRHKLESNLQGANFSKSNLLGARFGASILKNANFQEAILDRASFVTANLTGADFRKARLVGTTLQESTLHRTQLERVNFSKAIISGTSFDHANLRHAQLQGAKNAYVLSFRGADLRHANLKGLDLQVADFQHAILHHTQLDNSNLRLADFTNADLTNTSFSKANVKYALFTSTKGLSKASRKALEARSQRWKYDWYHAITKALQTAYLPSYLLTTFALFGLSLLLLVKKAGGKWLIAAGGINILLLMPFTFLILMYIGRASPVAQINAGSSAAMNIWSFWVFFWPFCFIGTMVLGLLTVIVALVCFGRMAVGKLKTHRKTVAAYLLLTLLHCGFAFHAIIQYAPTA
jgi:uncharacterized protein YjbI with pentapeptide repeats